ncbi:TPA: hypothetical protein ACH3X2_007336 [Trebouxia sp. C0005]
MTSQVRQLSSLVSLPKILSDSLVTALAQTDPDGFAYRLVPRPVYPIKLAIAAEGLALGPDPCKTQCQIHLQHDEVGSEILRTDILSQECKNTSPIFSSHEHPICVWVGDGNLATVADACITIRLLSHPVQSSSSEHGMSLSVPSRRRKATWRQWLTCQDMQVEEPLLITADAAAPSMLQDARGPQELVLETILLQEVLLTAHMARAYEFPTLEGGLVKVEVVIGAPQRGPYHLALRQANPGTFFADHNDDDVFAVLPLPPRGRRSLALPPMGPSPPRPSPQGSNGPGMYMKGRLVSFKERDGDNTIGVIASGAAKDTANKPELRTARKSTSRKQLQFAPLQLGHLPAQPSRTPSNRANAELLSPGRSKSLGSVVDRALLKGAADAQLAVNKDRPHSAQFHRTVHTRDVTVFADERAALELVSQGSMQSAALRVSHSKEVPLLDADRRRSHSRASTPSAKDMQTEAPSLDFQIMQLTGDGQGSFLSRCVRDDRRLCISTKDQHGKWQVWAHLHYPSGPTGHLRLQDVQVVLSASSPSSLPAALTDPLSSGSFWLSSGHCSSSLPAHSPSTPLSQAPAHHWLWRRTAASPAAAAAADAVPSSAPTTSKPSGINLSKETKQGKTAKGSQDGPGLTAESSLATGLMAASLQSSSEAGASSSSAEGGLVDMACIAVRPVESVIHSQPSLAATKLYGSKEGSRSGSKAGSRSVSRNGSRAGSRRNLLVSQLSEAGSISQTDTLADRCEWHPRRRATGDDVGWRGRVTDDSSVSGASRREPCPLALWFHESCASQVV